LYNFIHRSPTKEYHEQTIASFIFNAPSILLSRVFVKMRRRNCILSDYNHVQQFTTGQFEAMSKIAACCSRKKPYNLPLGGQAARHAVQAAAGHSS
jgi:hypothetical protein